MKKLVGLLFVIMMGLSLCACGTKGNTINNIQNEPSIVGVITEVQDQYIQIYIEKDGYPSGALCNVSLNVENKDNLYSPMKVGDEVVVYFSGEIAESYPMQINKVYGITLQKPVSE